jgi:threonine-phosphate decarboxylase
MSLRTRPLGAIASALPAHGGQLRTIAQQFGISADQLLDFSASVNPDGPPLSVVAALRHALDDPATLALYPDLEHTILKQAISRYASIPMPCISVANGFVPLLQAFLQAKQISRCLLPVPAFGEYRRSLEQAGITVIPYPIEPSGFRYHPFCLVQALLTETCDAVLLANPQNPSGSLCPIKEMLTVVKAAAAHGITVFLDEAFIDYTPAESLARQACVLPNLIIFRSVTKFFAIPGLRVAYAVSHPAQTSELIRALPPWPISTLAAIAVCAALKDEQYVEQARQRNLLRRTHLQQELALLECDSYLAHANFFLLKLPVQVEARTFRERLIREERIVVRGCEDFEGLSQNHLRIAVRTDEDNQRLIRALGRMLPRLHPA